MLDPAYTWLVWVILLAIFMSISLGWWVLNRPKPVVDKTPVENQTTDIETPEVPETVTIAEPEIIEDLTLIKGIGPKAFEALVADGITTFEELADSDPTSIKEVMVQAGLKSLVPDGWAEQAKIAASGNLEELKHFQSQLKR